MLKIYDTTKKTLVCAVYDVYKNENEKPISDSETIYEVDADMNYDDTYEAVMDDLKKRYPDCEIDLWSIDEMRF